jgi:prolyl 4-hydroxylase
VATSEAELLQQRAESGDPGAQMTLAILLDNRGMHQQALSWLRSASENGYAEAQYVLGARLVVGRAAPFEPEEGAKWLSSAANQGMPEALSLMAVLSSMTQQWTEATTYLKDAAERGDARAQQQVALLADPSRFDARKWDVDVEPKWKHQSPRVGVIEGFIPPAFCNWLIERAKPKLHPARLKAPAQGAGQQAGYRTNSGAGFGLLDSDFILQMINGRVADAIGVPMQNHEPTNVLHYQKGEEYKPHFDFITASESNAVELANTGQRVATVLIYLNDDYEGGETEFPNLKWKFKGKTGDALVFWNVGPDNEPDRKTLHAGLPVKKGEKWLYSKWVRANPYPLL